MRGKAVACCLLTMILCAQSAGAQQNALLDTLATEDQLSRTGGDVARDDSTRVRLVLEQLVAGTVTTPLDRFRAALILDHTPLRIRDGRVVATSPDNYYVAHCLASAAWKAGYAPARQLVAMTLDRYLTFATGRQKYGTSQVLNVATGELELPPIDRSTTDEERALLGIPPLAALLAKHREAQVTRK